jgi:hypothetical protein
MSGSHSLTITTDAFNPPTVVARLTPKKMKEYTITLLDYNERFDKSTTRT